MPHGTKLAPKHQSSLAGVSLRLDVEISARINTDSNCARLVSISATAVATTLLCQISSQAMRVQRSTYTEDTLSSPV